METWCDGIVIAGSSTKGFSALGYLEKNQRLLKKVESFSGTSSGSILVCMLACGYTPAEIFLLWNDELSPFTNPKACSMGLYSLDDFMTRLGNFLMAKGIVYFSDFVHPVYVVATDITEDPTEYCFSKETTPDVKVVDAIKASCSIPGIFPPVMINERMFIDGGLVNNFPYEYLKDCKQVFGINIKSSPKKMPTNFIEVLIKSVSAVTTKKVDPHKFEVYVDIEVPSGLKPYNMYFFGKNY